MLTHRRHGVGAFQLTHRHAVIAQRNARVVYAGFHQARELQRFCIHVKDMAGGVHHTDRPRRRNAIKLRAGDGFVIKVNGIKLPTRKRRVWILKQGFRRGERVKHIFDAFVAFPRLTIGIHAIKVTTIDVAPKRAFHRVGVPFNQTGEQHLIGKALVEFIIAPSRDLFEGTNRQNAPFPNRYMTRFWLLRVHGHNFFRGKNSRLHRNPSKVAKVNFLSVSRIYLRANKFFKSTKFRRALEKS